MGKPHWFPFYVADFLSSGTVKLMTNEERGAYVLLLCYEWQDAQCSLPADDDSIRILSESTGDLTRIKSCFIKKRGRLINERLYHEWLKVREKSDLAKKSADMRWACERNANALPTQCSSQSQSESELREIKEKKKMPPRAVALVDSDWITDLGKNPAYCHINLAIEIGKMEAWLALPKNHQRKKTRSFVLNWLNKIEAPMSNGQKDHNRPPPPPSKLDVIGRGQWKKAFGRPEDYGYV